MQGKVEELGLLNLQVFQVAIDASGGLKSLQVSDAFSKGTSSLLNFLDSELLDPYWASRPDSQVTKTIRVECLTLETLLTRFFEMHNEMNPNYAAIDFIKIDVQGKDYEVLNSIGKFSRLIYAGMFEAPVAKNKTLYENQDKTISKYFSLLEDLNLETYQLKPNDPELCEYNIYFQKSGIDIRDHIEILNLNLNEIYLGNINPRTDLLNLIQSYENSLSWKITKPLRTLKRIFLKLISFSDYKRIPEASINPSHPR